MRLENAVDFWVKRARRCPGEAAPEFFNTSLSPSPTQATSQGPRSPLCTYTPGTYISRFRDFRGPSHRLPAANSSPSLVIMQEFRSSLPAPARHPRSDIKSYLHSRGFLIWFVGFFPPPLPPQACRCVAIFFFFLSRKIPRTDARCLIGC